MKTKIIEQTRKTIKRINNYEKNGIRLTYTGSMILLMQLICQTNYIETNNLTPTKVIDYLSVS